MPAAQSLPVEPGPDRRVGRTELGKIAVSDRVVARLAARAALEVDDVGAAAPRVLGKDLGSTGLDRLGMRSTELGALPATSAEVDGQLAFIRLTLSVRYPAPVRHVAQQVRETVQARVAELCGLDVREVDISVPALVTELPTPPRVR